MFRRCVLALALAAVALSSPVQAETPKDAGSSAKSSEATGTATEAAPEVKTINATEPQASEVKDAKAGEPAVTLPLIGQAAKATATVTAAAEPAKPAPPPEPTLKASIDLKTQTMSVSEHGMVKYSWKVSSGTSEYPTPRGTFRPQWTAKMWYSRKYDNAPMPNAVFINGGVAVHATYHVGSLGRPASHGCIRLAPSNAKTFYNLVHKHGLKMTRVSVYGTPRWSAPAIASRKLNRNRDYASRNDGSYRVTSAYDQGFTGPRRNKQPRIYYYSNNGSTRYYARGNGSRVVYYRPRRTQSGFGYSW